MHLGGHDIDIWLPPSYDQEASRRYPVLYMHDGQNLFDASEPEAAQSWGVDDAITRLAAEGRVREAIVVGVWSTARRRQEYMPLAPVQEETGSGSVPAGRLSSDAHLDFLVRDLKPTIDARYRTMPDREDTFVAGSSMGGLVSLYAAAQHPDVFGGVAALSPHWPAGDGVVIDWLAGNLPDPASHRLYFDHGTRDFDAEYGPYQHRMDEAMRRRGYVQGTNWITRVSGGDGHEEQAWRGRLPMALEFLLRRG